VDAPLPTREGEWTKGGMKLRGNLRKMERLGKNGAAVACWNNKKRGEVHGMDPGEGPKYGWGERVQTLLRGDVKMLGYQGKHHQKIHQKEKREETNAKTLQT